ncbi:MAG: saccharopine dehydrogenase NADP-binding domain-containing protein [Bacteroidetes bacterium]|nr:saccharopine dehydrogenase NADP-binding domain-containing protein [Bacteroidota bacterium]
MPTILIFGAGKSATYLIDYLADSCAEGDRHLLVADLDSNLAASKLRQRSNTQAVEAKLDDQDSRRQLIENADVVISMLPAGLHPVVAADCLELGKHFFTASYESEALRAMQPEILAKGLLFLNECGLDPGIDHMSALKIIHEVKVKGEVIRSFKSYCGGLLAPQSEDNPWKYKFTWNPRNVVLAGQGTSKYLDHGEVKIVPYHQLFKRIETVSFPGLGDFDGYPNRDSLSYQSIYGLYNIATLLRGTLRRAGFCKGWDVLVQLGLTDDSSQLQLPSGSTYRQFLNIFLNGSATLSMEEKLTQLIPDIDFPTFEKLQWLGFFDAKPLPLTEGSPAQLLQAILEEQWALLPEDRDLIVMQHQIEVVTEQGIKTILSSLVAEGKDALYTAMAKTVGLPLAIAVDLFLQGKITVRGLQLPVVPEIYLPILEALEKEGIRFDEEIVSH